MTEPTIIFENEFVVVVNKPVGLLVHTDGRDANKTLVDWFLDHYPQGRGVGESADLADGSLLERSGIVHRLDRETSGVMILAKNQATYEALKDEFHNRQIYKEYRAFVYGWMKDKRGNINRPIGRSRHGPRRRSAERGSVGKQRSAITDWQLLKQGTYGAKAERFAYLKLVPKTGRTHQLRAHLKAIHRPIVGDELYAPSSLRAGSNLDIDRLALHAHCLEIKLPNLDQQSFTAPIPQIFTTTLKRMEIIDE